MAWGKMNRFETKIDVSPSVLTRALEQKAADQITEQDMARFHAKWSEATSGVILATSKRKKKTYAFKTLSLAAAVVIVFIGIAVLNSPQFNPIEKGDAVFGGVTSSRIVYSGGNDAAAESLAALLGGIEFIGGDCECGHENPDGAYIKGDEEALTNWDISWAIKPSGSDRVIFAGNGTEVSPEFAKMKNGDQNGLYTLFFYLEDGKHYTITMDRDFEIS
jgi:hypothetical protein